MGTRRAFTPLRSMEMGLQDRQSLFKPRKNRNIPWAKERLLSLDAEPLQRPITLTSRASAKISFAIVDDYEHLTKPSGIPRRQKKQRKPLYFPCLRPLLGADIIDDLARGMCDHHSSQLELERPV